MKREKARLAELRAMSYEQYLQTPEWKELEKASLKRADNRCQVCRSAGVALRVHHTTLDTLGCEQEADVMVLCEGCYDTLAQKMRQAIQKTADQADVSGEEEASVPTASLVQRALVFAPAALGLDTLMFLMHAPPPAEIGGLVAAFVLAAKFPSIYASIRAGLPEPLQILLDGQAERRRARAARGEWSTWDKLMGHHMNAQSVAPHEDRGTEPDEFEQDLGDELAFNFAGGRKLPAYLDLSPDLHLAPGEIIGKSIFIAGQRRSGKTTLGALLAEQMGDQYIPLFIPDREGDYLSVYEHLPRGVIAGAPGSYDDQPDINFWAVTLADADILGFQILYEGMQVILDLNTFELDEGFAIVNRVIKGLFEFARQYPKRLCPVEVFLDEAQKYLPQDLSTSAIHDQAIVAELLDSYKDLSGTGGKRGLTPVILSQRFAETNNKIMAQSEMRFILRQTHDTDLDRCMKYVEKGVATREQIHAFAKGQGIYIGDDGTNIITHFNKRRSDGSRSHTPGAEAAQRYMDMPMTLQKNQGRLPATRSRLPETPAPAAELEQSTEEQEALEERTNGSYYHRWSSEQTTRARERDRRLRGSSPQHVRGAPGALAEGSELPSRANQAAAARPQIYEVPRQDAKEERWRLVPANDLAKGFALWQAGYDSVRKLEEGAKVAGYGWSNGYCRDVREALINNELIQGQKKEAGVL